MEKKVAGGFFAPYVEWEGENVYEYFRIQKNGRV